MVQVESLTRPEVLAALYNASRPQGMGILHYDPQNMTPEQAAGVLEQNRAGNFDYLRGRVMKVSLPEGLTAFDERLYDRDLGEGAAQRAIAQALASKT